MARIYINCPVKHVPVLTGMSADAGTLLAFSDNTFGPCPVCGNMHTWSGSEAWLEGSPPKIG